MKRIIASLLGAFALLASWGAASSEPSPHMTGEVSAPECVDAMAITKHMYASTATYVYAPLEMPDHWSSTMILGATEVDISGGNALVDDANHFEDPYADKNEPSISVTHWGKDVTPAGRIVVTDTPFSWQGDTYSLYVLPADITPEQFDPNVAGNNARHQYSPMVDGSWRAPLVLWSQTTRKPWAIDVGDIYEQTGQWRIILANGNGYRPACTIKFWPDQGHATAPRILPSEVRQLADLLDQTLGYGPEQGTLQPTTRLRMHALHIWRNVAYRPWALSDGDAYNSKEQVDDGLLQWSHTGPSYARAYVQIQHAYPAAEDALARYYESQFRLSRRQAKQSAHWILDVAYRSNFVFSGGTPFFMKQDNTNPNPWVMH